MTVLYDAIAKFFMDGKKQKDFEKENTPDNTEVIKYIMFKCKNCSTDDRAYNAIPRMIHGINKKDEYFK